VKNSKLHQTISRPHPLPPNEVRANENQAANLPTKENIFTDEAKYSELLHSLKGFFDNFSGSVAWNPQLTGDKVEHR